MQSLIDDALTHTSGSDFILRAHCSHFFCSAWLIQHHLTTLSSSELPDHTHKFKFIISETIMYKEKAIFHLHVQGPWARPHSPVPEPGSYPYHPSKRKVYRSHLWREGHFHHRLLIQIVGTAGVPFPSSQMPSVRKSTKKCQVWAKCVLQRLEMLFLQSYLGSDQELPSNFAVVQTRDHTPSRASSKITLSVTT